MKMGIVFWGLFSICSICWCAEVSWQEVSRGIVNVKFVVVDPGNQKVVYLGSDKGLFKSADGGETWNNLLQVRGSNRSVNYLVFDKQVKNRIFAATAAGLYASSDAGKRWERIFQGKNYSEGSCTSVALVSNGILLGTNSGLFKSNDGGRSWHKETGKLGESQIFNITCSSIELSQVYIASTSGAYRSLDSGSSWQRIYFTKTSGQGSDFEDEVEGAQEEDFYSGVKYIALDPKNINTVYLATNRGIYKSSSQGLDWELFPDNGLLSRDTQFLALSEKSKVYAIAKSGLFVYQGDRWEEVSLGLPASIINFMGFDKEANLYVCTDKGLFRAALNFKLMSMSDDIVMEYTKGEPGIESVQQAAINYAEVNPEKIALWRKQACAKALLPEVNFGLDRNTTDLWHWEGGSTTKADDDTLRRGRDSLDWGVVLSWDLGKLIWNDDQTSIDTRSRLTVQLRNDILDEVVKLYFERIRVKMEMDSLQIEDRRKRFEKELRVKELTASIDSLTGGYFSKQINANGKSV